MRGWHISVYKLLDPNYLSHGPDGAPLTGLGGGDTEREELVARLSKGDTAATLVEGMKKGARIAVWQSGVRGLDWIDQLVRDGRAVAAGGDGYPSAYFAQAEGVVGIVAQGPPEAKAVWSSDPGDILLPPWEGRTNVDTTLASSCSPDEWLFIEVWDES